MGLVGPLLFVAGFLLGSVLIWRLRRPIKSGEIPSPESSFLDEGSSLLTRQGFKILEREKREMVEVLIWGKRMADSITVDFIVEKASKRFTVVVDHTDEKFLTPIPGDVRRKVLEARLACPEQDVLLVRTRTGEITEVEYQTIRREKIRPIGVIFVLSILLLLLFIFIFFIQR